MTSSTLFAGNVRASWDWASLYLLAVACVLAVAAVAKLQSAAATVADQLLAVGELVLAGGLVWVAVSEHAWRRTAVAGVVALFAAFAGWNVGHAVLGSKSCGCFGDWSMHPLATASLDLLIAAVGLVIYRRSFGHRAGVEVFPRRHGWPVLLVTCLGVSTAGAATASAASMVKGWMDGCGSLVLIDEQTVAQQGRRVVKSLTGVNAPAGAFTLAVLDPHCQTCKEKLVELRELATREWVVIVMTSAQSADTGDLNTHGTSGFLANDLSDCATWIGRVPWTIRMEGGAK